jgi:hypothetical protein
MSAKQLKGVASPAASQRPRCQSATEEEYEQLERIKCKTDSDQGQDANLQVSFKE